MTWHWPIPGRSSFRKAFRLLESLNSPQARTADYYALLGANFLQLNDAQRTLENLRKAVALDPQNPEYAYDLGFALNKNGNHREALDLLKKSELKFPRSAKIALGLGMSWQGLGKSTEAERSFQKALQLEPTAPEISLALGELYASEGQLEKARNAFAQAIHLEPGNGLAHYKQGVTLLKLQQSLKLRRSFGRLCL